MNSCCFSSTQESHHARQSGQIAGILRQLGDELAKGLAEATAAEEAAIESYGELMEEKTRSNCTHQGHRDKNGKDWRFG